MCAKISLAASDKVVDLSSLCSHIIAVCEKAGLSEHDANVMADSISLAHLRGIDTHGLRALPNYLNRVESGAVAAKPDYKLIRDTPISAVLDGGNGLGQVVGAYAMEMAINKAKTTGIGMVAVKNSNHFGACAFFSMMAQKEGLIGIAISNSMAHMAPTGGKTPCYGNNPWSFAFPCAEGTVPVVVDMANSVVARSNINIAKKYGQKIPTNWALDKNGLPTDDPNEAYLLQPFGSYKGYAISIVGDLLAGGLSGSAMGKDCGSFTSLEKGQNLGHFFAAIDVNAFCDLKTYQDHIQTFLNTVSHSELATNSEAVYLPGEIEYKKYLNNMENGLKINELYLKELKNLCDHFGVEYSLS